MIAGRPTNLWLGLTSAVVGALSVSLIALGVDPVVVGTIAGSFGGVAGAAIALVAYQPPTLNPGDTFTTQTGPGLPNYTTTVAHPPAADPPPVPEPGG